MRTLIENYAPGEGNPGSRLLSSSVHVFAGLGADRGSIPANGSTPATFNYAGPEPSPHAWTVNGAPVSVPATLDPASGLMVSEVEVTAAQVGIVEIAVAGQTLTIEAI